MSRIIKGREWARDSGPLEGDVDTDAYMGRDTEDVAAVFASAEVMRLTAQRAERLLKKAAARASATVSEAESQARSLAEEAYNAGYASGRHEGLEAGRKEAVVAMRKEAAGHLDAMARAVEELQALRREILQEAEPELIKFASRIAEKILRRELADPSATVDVARSLIAEVEDESRVTVYLPEAAAVVSDVEERLQGASRRHLTIATDPALGPGDVRIETEWGWVDGRLALRWDRLMRAFEEAVVDDEGGG